MTSIAQDVAWICSKAYRYLQ